jgi:Mor family transcriptional regulator
MKNFLSAIAISALLISCSKKETIPASTQTDSTKIVDSINAVRTKINDSIRNKNHFKDFSGNHKFTHNLIQNSGTVDFKKIDGERDHYTISGNIKSGKNSVEIKGFIAVVSDKHMNFTGEITQSISENDNGKPYTRKGTKTFASKDGGRTYRLQDMVNGSGFVDYIDIHF